MLIDSYARPTTGRIALVATRARLTGLALTLALAALVAWPPAARAEATGNGQEMAPVTVEWFGGNFWRFTSQTGKVILANPQVTNPDSPIKLEDIARADLVLITNGHGDEVGQAVDIAKKTGARTLSSFELGGWLVEQGVPTAQVSRTNPGGRFRLEGVTVSVVGGVHGSGLPRPSATAPYGGVVNAYFLTFENGWTIFYGGSTAATSDMALWAEMYQPDAAILVLGGGEDPKDFAMSARLLSTNNPRLATVMPGHNRAVQTQGQTTVAEAQAAINDMGVALGITAPRPGEVMYFGG